MGEEVQCDVGMKVDGGCGWMFSWIGRAVGWACLYHKNQRGVVGGFCEVDKNVRWKDRLVSSAYRIVPVVVVGFSTRRIQKRRSPSICALASGATPQATPTPARHYPQSGRLAWLPWLSGRSSQPHSRRAWLALCLCSVPRPVARLGTPVVAVRHPLPHLVQQSDRRPPQARLS